MLKLSGEALMGKLDFGTDPEEVERISREVGIIRDRGVEVAIVVGAGNIYRGVDGAAQGMDRATGDWFGNVGLVTDLVPRAPFDPRRAVAMVCGPEVMMRHTVAALQKRGVADSRIYVSMERNMKCGTGICGHCQYGPHFICRDGPVFRFDDIAPFFGKGEV